MTELLFNYNGEENGDEDDVFQCGKCKKVFSVISQFIAHKQEHIGDSAGNKKTAVDCTSAAEQIELQVHSLDPSELGQQVILNDSDILSFSIEQNALITASATQLLTDIDAEVTYVPEIQQTTDSCVDNIVGQPVILTTSSSNSFLRSEFKKKTRTKKLKPLKPKGNVSTYDPDEEASLFANAYKGCRLILPKMQANVVYNTTVESAPRTIVFNDKILSGKILYTETSTDNQVFEFEDSKTATKGDVDICIEKLCTLDYDGSKAPLSCGSNCQDSPVEYPVTVSLTNDVENVITLPVESPVILSVDETDTEVIEKEPESSGKEGQDDTVATNSGGDGTSLRKNELKCDVCNKKFKKNFDLKQHLRSHTGEKPFQCVVCGRAFSQKSNVKKHMSTHKVWPGGIPQTLPKDPLGLASEDNPDRQDANSDGQVSPQGVTQTWPREPLRVTSENCDGQDANSDEHSSETTKKGKALAEKSYMCQYCFVVFSSYFALKTHLKEHADEKVYKCIQKNCNKMFTDLEAFVYHTEEHTAEVQYRCHVCSSMFKTLDEVGIHQYVHNTHKGNEKKPNSKYHRCVKCKSKFSTPEALDYHLSTCSHNFPCSYCGKVFLCERNLRRHLQTHGSGTYKCDKCSKEFRTESYYNSHKLVHTGDKPFKCQYCPSAFFRKDKLLRHNLIHESTKKFKCPFRNYLDCTREFYRQDKLKMHILTHSARNFCRKCKKSFSSKLALMQHQDRLKHWTCPPCFECGERFTTNTALQSHKCPATTGKTFNKHGSLQNRYRRKPREKRMQRAKHKFQENICVEDGSEPDGSLVNENVPTIEIIVFPMDTNISEQNHVLQNVMLPVEYQSEDNDTVLVRTEENQD